MISQGVPYPTVRQLPDAMAIVSGIGGYTAIRGQVSFYQTGNGVLVRASFRNLPHGKFACDHPIFGFHIHGGSSCTGNENDPLADVGSHYNPHRCPHPYHAGDMPPVFGVNGHAFSLFLTDRLTVREVIGKTVILHDHPDDFTSQPAGNAGTKIACGVIQPVRRR